jgi:hypothetical protein
LLIAERGAHLGVSLKRREAFASQPINIQPIKFGKETPMKYRTLALGGAAALATAMMFATPTMAQTDPAAAPAAAPAASPAPMATSHTMRMHHRRHHTAMSSSSGADSSEDQTTAQLNQQQLGNPGATSSGASMSSGSMGSGDSMNNGIAPQKATNDAGAMPNAGSSGSTTPPTDSSTPPK